MPSDSFDLEDFVDQCRRAVSDTAASKTVRELLARAMERRGDVVRALGEPTRAGVRPIHRSEELTVLDVVWAPDMHLLPHNHEMWAVIGVYTGREDNIFWKRSDDAPKRIEAARAKTIGAGDVIPLGPDIIHSVLNPLGRFTGAIHVYGGDFFSRPRSEWDPETLLEEPYDVERNMKRFEAANALHARG